MKNNRRLLAVDMGNYNVKTSTGTIFKSVYQEYDYKNELLGDDVLTYGDRKYVIGKGSFDNEGVKSQKKNPIPLMLNALYKSLGLTYATVDIVVGLPLSQHKDKKIVQELKNLYTGEFEFWHEHNSYKEKITYTIQNVMVFPESMGAFFSLNEDMDGRDVLMVDVGGGTVNIAFFSDGEYVDSTTCNFGTVKVLDKIRDKANLINTGATFSKEDIEKYLGRGEIRWDGKIDRMLYKDEIVDRFTEEIINEIKGKFPNYRSYEVRLSGGGVDLFKSSLGRVLNFDIIPNNLFANAVGFYNVVAEE